MPECIRHTRKVPERSTGRQTGQPDCSRYTEQATLASAGCTNQGLSTKSTVPTQCNPNQPSQAYRHGENQPTPKNPMTLVDRHVSLAQVIAVGWSASSVNQLVSCSCSAMVQSNSYTPGRTADLLETGAPAADCSAAKPRLRCTTG